MISEDIVKVLKGSILNKCRWYMLMLSVMKLLNWISDAILYSKIYILNISFGSCQDIMVCVVIF